VRASLPIAHAGSLPQDRRLKVSLFLRVRLCEREPSLAAERARRSAPQDQVQNNDGSFVMTHAGRLPQGASTPGTIT
jgi:hypothetical protein